jgi:hypothetical protein
MPISMKAKDERKRAASSMVSASDATRCVVVPRQSQELLIASVAFVVDADNALGARRPAIGAGEPATGFLDPEHRSGHAGPHAIFDPVGRAVATMRGRCMTQRVHPDRALRLDQFCKLRAARQRCRRDTRED